MQKRQISIFLQKKGSMGYMYPIKEGFVPDSDNALVSILGNGLKTNARGQFEALGLGIRLKRGDLEKEIKIGLKKAMQDIIIEPDNILDTIKAVRGEKPFVILFFGINGAGKTTSLAKFSNLLKKEGITSVLAAADTFRAASMEQLQIHADKLGLDE